MEHVDWLPLICLGIAIANTIRAKMRWNKEKKECTGEYDHYTALDLKMSRIDYEDWETALLLILMMDILYYMITFNFIMATAM